MAKYIKKGHSFTKNFIIPNKYKTRILFGVQLSIGINAREASYFDKTSNWFFIGGGINVEDGAKIHGIFLRWGIKND
jgi:hypothetical protein